MVAEMLEVGCFAPPNVIVVAELSVSRRVMFPSTEIRGSRFYYFVIPLAVSIPTREQSPSGHRSMVPPFVG